MSLASTRRPEAQPTPDPDLVWYDCVQRTDAWFHVRCGRLTGSRAYDILPRRRGLNPSVARLDYRRQLITEQTTQRPQERRIPETQPIVRGRHKEGDARDAYAAHTNQVVYTCGFLAHARLQAGTSIDGYVEDLVGVLEIKCPNTLTHLAYLAGHVPAKYRAQIVHHLWISGAAWCDFVSFDDRLPFVKRLAVRRFTREELATEIAAYAALAEGFLAEIAHQVAWLRTLGPLEFFATAPLDVALDVFRIAKDTVQTRVRQAGQVPAARTQPIGGVA
jgi:putative phage-type endonuclease